MNKAAGGMPSCSSPPPESPGLDDELLDPDPTEGLDGGDLPEPVRARDG